MTVIRMNRPAPAGVPTGASQTTLSERVRLGIERNRTTRPEVHPYRAVAVTRSHQETEGEPIAIRRAKMLYRVLADQPVTIQRGELIVGMKTLTPRGSPVYPEINSTWIERDLDRLATRKDTPFFVSDATKHILKEEVFPYWRGRQIADRINAAVPSEIWQADERGVIYNYFRSRTIGHFQAAYDKVLAHGLEGIVADVEASLARLDRRAPEATAKAQFLESVILACRGAILFAGRYAAEARRLARLAAGLSWNESLKFWRASRPGRPRPFMKRCRPSGSPISS
jgi:pyruvate-formate lyase